MATSTSGEERVDWRRREKVSAPDISSVSSPLSPISCSRPKAKRRARDSNPQHLTVHLISNEAVSHSLTLRTRVRQRFMSNNYSSSARRYPRLYPSRTAVARCSQHILMPRQAYATGPESSWASQKDRARCRPWRSTSPWRTQRRIMMRFGLCCMFRDQPIKFRTTTAAAVARMKRADRLVKVSSLCLANADARPGVTSILCRQRNRLLSNQQSDPATQDTSRLRL